MLTADVLARAQALRTARAGEVLAPSRRGADPWAAHIASRAHALRMGRSGYKGAEESRMTMDWPARLDRADREVLRSITKLRARARDLVKNSNPVRHFNRLLQANVIGARGFRIKTRASVKKSWEAWAKSKVTVDGKLTFNQFSRLALKTVATDGEVLVRFYRNFPNRWGFALQAIDADQLDESYNLPRSGRQNEVRMGVEVDVYGRPVAYHVYQEASGMWAGRGERVRIPADEIVHIYDPDRVNQSRGVTWFVSVMFPIKMLDGYKEAEVTAARISSSKMGFFTPREGATGEMLAGEKDEQGNIIPPVMDAQPGLLEALPPGYEFVAWDPTHPSTAFPAFIKALMRDIASGVGVSYNALANDLESTSYSSARFGALLDRDAWSILQEWWEACWLTPIFNEWRTYAYLKGAVDEPTRLADENDAVEWIARGWDWVDPLKDIQASSQAITAGLTSRTRIVAERGDDLPTIFQELADEEELAQTLGIDVTPKGAAFAPVDPAKDEGDTKSSTTTTDESTNGNGRSRLGAHAR